MQGRFMLDIASRMAGRTQLTTDGHRLYVDAVALAFGQGVDYAQLVKAYDDPVLGAGQPN